MYDNPKWDPVLWTVPILLSPAGSPQMESENRPGFTLPRRKEKYKAHQLVLIPAWTFDLKTDESATYLAVALMSCPKRPCRRTILLISGTATPTACSSCRFKLETLPAKSLTPLEGPEKKRNTRCPGAEWVRTGWTPGPATQMPGFQRNNLSASPATTTPKSSSHSTPFQGLELRKADECPIRTDRGPAHRTKR